ncbi:MAG: tRNA (adenosine(37)-N6)-threonylcarbamoyltransferase complex transferase subunit TsaD, partial [Candidatus Omnitrophica bacterium]|nr:tRNA (adenosine(37)-N6)-threonylcarbamoyltransferase complex transferase subunit TsaD [Candidatus Omnitrophota bacterium]
GGVIPEIASRMQLETITAVTDEAIKESGLQLRDLKLISVTSGPGLLGSLLVGVSFAKALSLGLSIPLQGVNHVHSHFYANFLNGERPALPFTALVVSGGHTSLYYVKNFDRIQQLGSTQDDACGESFDKVAKILGLGYPGGPLVERLAEGGDPKKLKFKCCGTKNPLDFSFSGIKTAVLYYVSGKVHKSQGHERCSRADIAASFQETVIEALIQKSFLACDLKNTKRLVIGGGVVANSRLREKFLNAAKDRGINCYFPPRSLCIDNAAMVAGFAYQLFKKGYSSGLDLNATTN